MIPMRNRKKNLEVTIEEMRNFSFGYIEKYASSKQQLRTYLLDRGSATATKGRTATVDYLHSKFKDNMTTAEVKEAIKIIGLHRKHNTSAGVSKQRAAKYYQFFYGSQDFNEVVVKPLKTALELRSDFCV